MEKPKILIVDDTPAVIALISATLKKECQVLAATDGDTAMKIIGQNIPDLILLDVIMPGKNGYQICRCLKNKPETHDIPIIFITALDDEEDESKGFALGAVDYISKPISPEIVKARVKTHVDLKRHRDQLEQLVAVRTRALIRTQDVTMLGISTLAEYRDEETGEHIRRTQHYVRLLAEKLCRLPKFRHQLTPERIGLLFRSAPLHDIGKVAISDHILLKNGGLSPEEVKIMKGHAIYGFDALARAETALEVNGNGDSFLRMGKEIAVGHHENMDGTGYPHGLAGEEIPIAARIMKLADVYDALRSKRHYKPPFSHEEAVRIIATEGDGRVMPSHFDPDTLKAFLELEKEFQEVAKKFAD